MIWEIHIARFDQLIGNTGFQNNLHLTNWYPMWLPPRPITALLSIPFLMLHFVKIPECLARCVFCSTIISVPTFLVPFQLQVFTLAQQICSRIPLTQYIRFGAQNRPTSDYIIHLKLQPGLVEPRQTFEDSCRSATWKNLANHTQ